MHFTSENALFVVIICNYLGVLHVAAPSALCTQLFESSVGVSLLENLWYLIAAVWKTDSVKYREVHVMFTAYRWLR